MFHGIKNPLPKASLLPQHDSRHAFFALFGLGMALKLALAFFTGSQNMSHLFLPFMHHYLAAPFTNPYTFFLHAGKALDSFPYGPGMLWFFALPTWIAQLLGADVTSVITPASIFLGKMSNVIADIGIFSLLLWLVPARRMKILGYYWFNPVVWFVCYFHGQLDLIPTFVLFLAAIALHSRKEWWAYLILGLGIAVKAHLLIAMPFFLITSYYDTKSLTKGARNLLVTIVAAAAVILPFMSDGYWAMVLNEPKSRQLFQLAINLNSMNQSVLYITPAILLVLLYRFTHATSANRDFFLVNLGFIYGALIVFIDPMPGWAIWCLPFLMFSYCKYSMVPLMSLYVYWTCYVCYFVLAPGGDFFSSFAPLMAGAASAPPWNWPNLCARAGLNYPLTKSLFFTGMQASLLASMYWLYKTCISSQSRIRQTLSSFAIGISGDSGVGKSSLTPHIINLVGPNNSVVLAGDDLHKWERDNARWQTLTPLNPLSNRLHSDIDFLEQLKKGRAMARASYDHHTGRFSGLGTVKSAPFLIFQGLHTLYLKRMRRSINLKIYLDPQEELRLLWKARRDMAERGYSLDQVLASHEKRRADAETFVKSQIRHADIIIRFQLTGAEQALSTLLEHGSVGIEMQLVINNDLNFEDLYELLERNPGLSCNFEQNPEREVVNLSFNGDISKEQVQMIGDTLYRDQLDVHHHAFQWSAGYYGVIQLFILAFMVDYYRYEMMAELT